MTSVNLPMPTRAHGGYWHPAKYYVTLDNRETEILANIVSLYGSGPMGQRLLKQFVPKLTRLVLRILEGVE